MPEKIIPVSPVKVKYVCDECGEGEMHPTDKVMMSDPAQYTHRCDNCDAEKTFRGIIYPHIRFLDVEVV